MGSRAQQREWEVGRGSLEKGPSAKKRRRLGSGTPRAGRSLDTGTLEITLLVQGWQTLTMSEDIGKDGTSHLETRFQAV